MKKVSKIISLLIVFVMTIGVTSAGAYEFPKNFWDLAEKFNAAQESENYEEVIEYGSEIVEMMLSEPDCEKVRATLCGRAWDVGKAYVELGDFEESLEYFNIVVDTLKDNPYEFNDYWYDTALRAVQDYTTEFTLYTDRGTSPYYGAVNEKKNGVLFGLCADGGTRQRLENESMVLVYQEFGQELLAINKAVVRNAQKDGIAVVFALNCPNQGADIRNFYSKLSYLEEISKLFAEFSSVPVYLRFGAEFDIWQDMADAEEYKKVFRYVSDYFSYRSNVAIVWSPAQASSYDVNVHDYYPGDEYVDWVGVSSYADKYYGGNPDESNWKELYFKKGPSSSPVLAIREIVETYGDRKPIMLSESGCGHHIIHTNEDTTDFAIGKLREYYSYVPMVYPQVKLIAYFDQHVRSTDTYDYRLSGNVELKKEYLKLTRSGRFIQGKYDNGTGFCYRKVHNNIGLDSTFVLAAYVHVYDDEIENVTYRLDGKFITMSDRLPYTVYIDGSKYAGEHTITAVAKTKSGKEMTREYKVSIAEKGKSIKVYTDEERVFFDQTPVIYSDRTMVPLRAIFESLGAKVKWDAETRTAIGKKGDTVVKITADSTVMYVNDKKIILDAPAFILSSRILVPVRAVAEGLGCDVQWYSRETQIYISSK